MPSAFFADLRFALRLIRRSPGFYALVIGFVAAGVGALTAVFSIVHAMLLRPLPYPEPDALMMLRTTGPWVGVGNSRVTLPDFLDWKAQATTFERMAAIRGESMGVASEGAKPERLPGAMVSGDFFELFGVRALHGRLLEPKDDRPGAPCVAVVSASAWRRRFASDPSLVGRVITLNGKSCSVVGVAPEGFAFADDVGSDRTDVWTPLAVMQSDYARMSNSDRAIEGQYHFLNVVGRRKPGVSDEHARAELSSIAARLVTKYPEINKGKGVELIDLQEFFVRGSRTGAWLLFTCVALVFLVVCANVANLMLTRAQARRNEMATRVALGATRARLAAQLLTETSVVFLFAAAAGGALANILVDFFAAAVVQQRAVSIIDIRVHVVALLVSIAGCVFVGLLFAIAPALAMTHVEPQNVLRETAAQSGVSRAQKAVRGGLVVAQVALASALLVGSGLALRALDRLSAIPLGFDAEKLVSATVILPETKYPGGGSPDWLPVERVVEFYRSALLRIRAQPGVEMAAIDACVPINCGAWSVAIEGRSGPGLGWEIGYHSVAPGHFRTLKIPLLKGRDFTDADVRNARPVIIINQAAAERFFPGEDPLGHRIDSGLDQGIVWREVVGVVGDVRSNGPYRPVGIDGYLPLEQVGAWDRSMTFLVRSKTPEVVLRDIPRSIEAIDPDQELAELALVEDLVSDSMKNQRSLATLLSAFAIFAVLLSALGLFGLVSYATAQRTRELGIRLALGSMPEGVMGLVLKSGLRWLGAGLAVGLVLAILLGRELAERIPHASAFDLEIFAVVLALLGVVGILGCLIPAWRAARIAPARALRYE